MDKVYLGEMMCISPIYIYNPFDLNQINRLFLPRQNNESIRHLHSRRDLNINKKYHLAITMLQRLSILKQYSRFLVVFLIYIPVSMVSRTKEAD